MTAMSLSKRGAGFSAAHEAIYLYAYPDPGTNGEPWTIGIGHTRAAGLPAVKRGDRISMARAVEIYRADMGRVERDVRKVPAANQAQFDAMCSFHLNTGALLTGTVDDKLKRGDVAGALKTWGAYINAGGRPMAGLRTRRAEEIALFRTGAYPSRRILVRDTPTSTPRSIAVDALPWGMDTSAPTASATAPVIAIDRPLPPAPVQPRQAASWWSVAWRWIIGA